MKTFLLDGDILVYVVAFSCKDETRKSIVRAAADKVLFNLLRLSECDNYIGFLTDSKSNFRNTRATTLKYKGNRDKVEDPAWKEYVKQYFINTHGWQVMYGIEADDALVIAAEHLGNENVVCGTIDKDLLQYPWKGFVQKGKIISISEQQAHLNLWTQVILGDKPTDNIPGLSHAATYMNSVKRGSKDELWGPVKAKAFLEGDPDKYAPRILSEYIDAYHGNDIPEGIDTEYQCFGEYRFHETFDLVHMLREAPTGVNISYETQVINKEVKNEFIDN